MTDLPLIITEPISAPAGVLTAALIVFAVLAALFPFFLYKKHRYLTGHSGQFNLLREVRASRDRFGAGASPLFGTHANRPHVPELRPRVPWLALAALPAVFLFSFLPAFGEPVYVNNWNDLNHAFYEAEEVILGENITIDYDASVTVSKDITLDLNGKSIYSSSSLPLFYVRSTLTLVDRTEDGNPGSITGSNIVAFVFGGGTFKMESGTITGADGVYVDGGTFEMTGGSIENCSGTGVETRGTFTMSGGSITYNFVGVNVSAGTFNLGSGTNGAKIDISGNTQSGSPKNVSLGSGININITGKLADGSTIGVTKNGTPPIPFAVGTNDHTIDEKDLAKFSSDGGYGILLNTDGLYLYREYTLTYNGNDADEGTPPAGGTYVSGATVTVPDNTGNLKKAGSAFSGWNTAADGLGESYSPGNTFTITGDMTLFAQWDTVYSVTVTSDGNGSADAKPTSGTQGTEVALTAVPNEGFAFKEWQVVSGGVTVTENKFTIGTSDVEVKAVFEALPPETYSVSVTTDGSGSASASVSSGTQGTEVALTASPKEGFAFKEWQVVSGGVTVTENKFTIGTADVEVKAVFEELPPDTFSVTVTTDGSGSASASVSSGTKGTEVTLTAVPNEGFAFKEWQVVSGGVTVTENKFTIGTSDVEVKAVFTATENKNAYELDAAYTDPEKTAISAGTDYELRCGLEKVYRFILPGHDELAFDNFTGLRMDGQTVDQAHYSKSRGSVIIRLKAEYLETLEPGKHTLTAEFTDGKADAPCNIVKNEKNFLIPVEFVFVQHDGTRGVPSDTGTGTLKPVIIIKDGDEEISRSAAIELKIPPAAAEDPPDAEFTKKVEDLAPGKYTVSVSGLPKEIAREIPDGDAADKEKIKLTYEAEINEKDGEIVITVYLIFDGRIRPKYEEPPVYPLPEDEIGAYWLKKDGTKEYLLFHTYDICMAWLGNDELCAGPERCFHKDGK